MMREYEVYEQDGLSGRWKVLVRRRMKDEEGREEIRIAT